MYCTLEDVRVALDLRGTASDSWLSSLLPVAVDVIDLYVGYSFTARSVTKTLSGKETEVLFVGDRLHQIVSVLEDSRDITSDCYIWPEEFSPGVGIARVSGLSFQEGRRNYTISAIFGYPSIPPAINRAAIRLVVHWAKLRDTNYSDVVSEQGSIRQKYKKDMPLDVIEILNQYRLRGLL